MRTIYWNSAVWCLLVGLNSQAQVNQATSASGGSTAAAEAAVQRAASNALHAASIIQLTNQMLEAVPAAPANTAAMAASTIPGAVAAAAVRNVSTNATQAVTMTGCRAGLFPPQTLAYPRPVRPALWLRWTSSADACGQARGW